MFDLESILKKQTIHHACKFRIYPTCEQETFLNKHFGCCRFIYNHILIRLKKAYKRRKESISIYNAKKFIPQLKKTSCYNFLQEVNSQSLQASVLNLGHARENFFNKEGGYPKLKKKNGRQSFEVPQNFLLKRSNKGNSFLLIPKLKTAIKVKMHREGRGEVRQVVISQESDGKYHASVNYRIEQYCVFDSNVTKKISGYDLGISDLYVSENGEKEKAPKFLMKLEGKLSRTQRNYSRKKRGSANKKKARLKIAIIHSKIRNKRKDFIHKQSNKIVNENQVIYFETLNIKGMMKNHCLAKAIADAMLAELIRQSKYKAEWRMKKVVQIGRFEATSKLCNVCEEKNNDLRLHHRIWKCKKCHTSHDRDINAAINIKKIGQGMPESTPVERTTSECFLARWCSSWLDKAGSVS